MTKVCSKCKVEKDIFEFSPNGTRNGVQIYRAGCKLCTTNSLTHIESRQKRAESNKTQRELTAKKCLTCQTLLWNTNTTGYCKKCLLLVPKPPKSPKLPTPPVIKVKKPRIRKPLLPIRTCKTCKVQKPLENFDKCGIYEGQQNYRGVCKICQAIHKSTPEFREQENKRRREDPEYREKQNEIKRTEEYKVKERIRDKKKYKEDPLYRLRKNIRRRTLSALKVKKWSKTTPFYKYIGCTQEELKSHIEKQWTEGMNWDNYGKRKNQWNLDHIYPLSLAKTSEEMTKLGHYTNIQPMWHEENVRKGNKIVEIKKGPETEVPDP